MYSSDLDLITKAKLQEISPARPQRKATKRLPRWVRRVARQWANRHHHT